MNNYRLMNTTTGNFRPALLGQRCANREAERLNAKRISTLTGKWEAVKMFTHVDDDLEKNASSASQRISDSATDAPLGPITLAKMREALNPNDITQHNCPAAISLDTHHMRPMGGTMFCEYCGHSASALRRAAATEPRYRERATQND